ncbi:Uncharacterised protein at_DN0857 [Pycnogonum litorale]
MRLLINEDKTGSGIRTQETFLRFEPRVRDVNLAVTRPSILSSLIRFKHPGSIPVNGCTSKTEKMLLFPREVVRHILLEMSFIKNNLVTLTPTNRPRNLT